MSFTSRWLDFVPARLRVSTDKTAKSPSVSFGSGIPKGAGDESTPTATPSSATAPATSRPLPKVDPLDRRLWTREQCIARYNREWVTARLARGERNRRERAAPAQKESET